MGTTTIELTDEQKDELDERKLHDNESYKDVVSRLLKQDGSGSRGLGGERLQFWDLEHNELEGSSTEFTIHFHAGNGPFILSNTYHLSRDQLEAWISRIEHSLSNTELVADGVGPDEPQKIDGTVAGPGQLIFDNGILGGQVESEGWPVVNFWCTPYQITEFRDDLKELLEQ